MHYEQCELKIHPRKTLSNDGETRVGPEKKKKAIKMLSSFLKCLKWNRWASSMRQKLLTYIAGFFFETITEKNCQQKKKKMVYNLIFILFSIHWRFVDKKPQKFFG